MKTTTRRVGRQSGYTTRKAAVAELDSFRATYPQHNYDLRVAPGGKFYIVCTTSPSS